MEIERRIATCNKCGGHWYACRVDEWLDEPCSEETCNGLMKLAKTHTVPFAHKGWPENGIVLEHAEANPVHLKSRSEAKKYAREHNVELGCL